MENSNSVILSKGYGLKLISSTRTRTGLVCKTDKGIKELKKVFSDEKAVIFEDAVKRHLKQRGFRGVGLYEKTPDGTPFFNYEDTRYVLEEHVPCKSADLTDRTILKKAVESLADIHGMTEDFLFEGDGKNGADLSQLTAGTGPDGRVIERDVQALIDAGKINELMGLLNAFGVQAVTQLKQDQLGAFATELRKLGAQI